MTFLGFIWSFKKWFLFHSFGELITLLPNFNITFQLMPRVLVCLRQCLLQGRVIEFGLILSDLGFEEEVLVQKLFKLLRILPLVDAHE